MGEFAAPVPPAAAALKSRAKRDHAERDDWAPSKNKQTELRRSEIFGKWGSGRFARDSRSSSGWGDQRRIDGGRRCRSQEAERDNEVGFVLNRLRNVYKHRRLAATLAREGGR
jgi:hypothetical protein